MRSNLGLVMGVATALAVLGTAPRVVLTQGVMKGDDAMITTTRSPSYHYSHYYYHPDARHATADEDRPPPPERNNVSNDSVGGGCPRDGAAERVLMDACPDISRLDSRLQMMSAVRGDNETAPSGMMMDIEQLLASPDAISVICRPISCLYAIRALPCISSTNNNATFALAKAVCGCHAALDTACQASFRKAAVLLPIGEVVASSAQSIAVVHHHHQPSHHNTSSMVLTDTAVHDSAGGVVTVDEHEQTTRPGGAVMQASDDVLAEEPSSTSRPIPCVPLHCRASLAEAEECATLAPLFHTDTYLASAHNCRSSSDGDIDATTDSDDCVDTTAVSNSSNCSVPDGNNSSSAPSVVRRQYSNDRDAANEVLAMAMPDSIMALMDVFIDPPLNTLVNGYLPPLERRVEMLREASIYGVGDAVTSPMRDICEWVSRSRNAASGAEGLFWDMLAEPDLITEVCRKVQSNGECLQTTVDVCLGGSTEDFIALMDAALTEELISRHRRGLLYGSYDSYYESSRERIQEDYYLRGFGWSLEYVYGFDWRTDAVIAVDFLLDDIIEGATSAYEEYWDHGEGMYGDVLGLLSRVVGPMCTSACESLMSSCEAISALSSLFTLDRFLKEPDGQTGMCQVVETPLLSFGAKQRLVRAEATLSGLAAVEDFTDALRSKFRQDMATAAHVPLSLVEIIDVRAGSVVVVTEVLIRADTDGAVEAYVTGTKATLDNPTDGIFESRYFGIVSWTAFGSSDPDDDESSDQGSKSSDADGSSNSDGSSDSDESSDSEESGVVTVFRIPAFGIIVFSLIAVVTVFC